MGYEFKTISKNPADIVKMPYIPPSILSYLPEKLGPCNRSHKDAIRQILAMRVDEPFARCKGKNRVFTKKCEAKGDMSHSDKKHSCPECACKKIAGAGSKGDFYGLGPETGHYGIGYCHMCEDLNNVSPGLNLKNLRDTLRVVQAYGKAAMSSEREFGLKLAQSRAVLVADKEKVRKDVKLVHDQLDRVQSLIKDGMATEMTPRGPEPMATKTETMLLLDIAKTMMKLDLGSFKMSEKDYVHISEVIKRIPEMMTLTYQCFSKLEELLVAKLVRGEEIETDRPIREYVTDIYDENMATIWDENNMKQGRK